MKKRVALIRIHIQMYRAVYSVVLCHALIWMRVEHVDPSWREGQCALYQGRTPIPWLSIDCTLIHKSVMVWFVCGKQCTGYVPCSKVGDIVTVVVWSCEVCLVCRWYCHSLAQVALYRFYCTVPHASLMLWFGRKCTFWPEDLLVFMWASVVLICHALSWVSTYRLHSLVFRISFTYKDLSPWAAWALFRSTHPRRCNYLSGSARLPPSSWCVLLGRNWLCVLQ